MKEEKKFSFFSFILIIFNIALVTALGIGVAYMYQYMEQNNLTLQEGIAEIKINIKQAVTNISNAETDSTVTLNLPDNIGTYKEQIREEEIVSDYYFYNQLSEDGKIIYNTIEGNLNNMKTGEYTIEFGTEFNDSLQTEEGKAQLKEHFQAAWDALALDNPKIFFIDVTKLYLTIESTTIGMTTTCTATIGPEEGENYLIEGIKSEDIEEYENTLEAIRNNVVSNVSGSDYDKIKQIHDALVEEIEYDQSLSKTHTHDIYGALVEKCVVCEGYAKAYKYLLDGIGIPCVLVSGQGTNSKGETEEHIWNYVLIDNKWYAVDVTWDDPIITGGGSLTYAAKYKYFLKGANTFNSNHVANHYLSNNTFRFEYPELSREDY